ncbi:hypothetical protein ACVJGD_000009 [Bradyrhizobium sp. USDA 10063]
MLHILASRRAEVQAGLPVLSPAHIDASRLRCKAQSVRTVVVSAPCRNPACRDLRGKRGATIQRLKAHEDARSCRTQRADQKVGTSMMCPPRRSKAEACSDLIDETVGDQVETQAPCVARSSGALIERPNARKQAGWPRIANPALA